MANITLLHWNIESYGPAKFNGGNNAAFLTYIGTIVHNVGADIFSMVEVKNSVAAGVATGIGNAAFALSGVIGPNPWQSVVINSGHNNEAYIIMYRNDRNFLPVMIGGGGGLVSGLGVTPENGLGSQDAAGNPVNFPSTFSKNGGRRPFYATFQTTDTNQNFSVLSYHAMFGNATANGIIRMPSIDYVTQFSNPANTAINASLLSGDFNVDFNTSRASYNNMLNLPSDYATNERTSLKNNPANSNDPSTFRANAYDNIFQKIPVLGAPPTGTTIDLMVESAVVPVVIPPVPPPAAQPGAGNLSAAAGAFNVATINNNLRYIANPIVAVPPTDMDTAWDFVREAISNHYPVHVTTTI